MPTASADGGRKRTRSAKPRGDPRSFDRNWLAPRFWATWLALGFLRVSTLLPYRLQLALGRAVGRALHATMGRRRHIAGVNVGLCFPELSVGDRARLVAATFESTGIAFFEVAMAWWASDERLRVLGRVEGLEHLDAALGRGKGVILLSGHFTTLEIGARLLRLLRPFRPMYRPTKNPLWDHVMLRARERHVEHAIDRRDVRGTLRALRANEPVWYAPDQDYGRQHSIFVPFFGVPAATITATARLAAMAGAPVVPFFQYRLADTGGYVVTLYPALEGFPSGDSLADAERINRIIEERVREHPEQYLWTHRRFKTRPAGTARVYE